VADPDDPANTTAAAQTAGQAISVPRLRASGRRSLPLSRRLALPIRRVKSLRASVGVPPQAVAWPLPGGRRAHDPADPQRPNRAA